MANYNEPNEAYEHHLLYDIGNPQRFNQVMIDGYRWEKRELPSYGGAAQFVFDALALAESTPIGPGVRQRTFWRTQNAPLIYPSQQAATAGFGGVIQGQFISQPLFDPYSGRYGNTFAP